MQSKKKLTNGVLLLPYAFQGLHQQLPVDVGRKASMVAMCRRIQGLRSAMGDGTELEPTFSRERKIYGA